MSFSQKLGGAEKVQTMMLQNLRHAGVELGDRDELESKEVEELMAKKALKSF